MKTQIELQEFPHRKRWMRGTVYKNIYSPCEIKNITWDAEIKLIIKQWFCVRYNVPCTLSDITLFASLASKAAEQRIQLFLHSIWIYDIRIIHLRVHKNMDSSFIKLKISFKRQHKKYYEHMKVLTRIII